MEIIEIGAVLLGSPTGPITAAFETFVRPIIEPGLTDFCRRLTSIRQSDVDEAPLFPEALASFVDWIGPDPFALCSWGLYDLNQFRLDCRRHGLVLPESFENHINLKDEFARQFRVKRCGMSQALQIAEIPLEGTHHRANDDARNIAKLAMRLLPLLEEA